MDRRTLLKSMAAIGCSAAASPLVTPMVMASAPGDARLVVIVLRGAMDGLDVVAPLHAPELVPLRPRLTLDNHIEVGRGWALHPALERLMPLWRAGEFGAVHAVSTPYRDKRSHFDGQDILEAGLPGLDESRARDGWLNRMLTLMPGQEAEVAYSINNGTSPLILEGAAPAASWSPNARIRINEQAERLLDLVTHDDPLFRAAAADAVAIAQSVEEEGAMGMEAGDLLPGGHTRAAAFAAQRLLGQTRIVSFSLGGWDTHGRQPASLRAALGRLVDTILTLKQGLGGVWDKTAVLCMTEFGRTVAQNGTLGTDHGTGGAMLYAGGALRGGRVAGIWPGLSELYDGRDLLPTRDIRAQAGWVMRSLYGLDRSEIENVVFPGLDLGRGSLIVH